MDTISRLKVLSLTALVVAVLAIYFTTLKIDGLAKARYYESKRNNIFKNVFRIGKFFNHSTCFSSSGQVHSIANRQIFEYPNSISRFSRQQKVHTRVIDAKLNKVYVEKINSSVEYIFQYTYPQDVCINRKIVLIIYIVATAWTYD